MDKVGADSTWPWSLSDVVHFTTHDSNLSFNKSGFCKLCTVNTHFRLDKVTRELRQTRALRHKTSLPCCRETARTNFVSKSKLCTFCNNLICSRFADLWVVKRTIIAS